MDHVLLVVDRMDVQSSTPIAENEFRGGDALSTAIEAVGLVASWTHAAGARLVLAGDFSTALVAGLSLLGSAAPREVERAEEQLAPIVFTRLPGSAPSEDERMFGERGDGGVNDLRDLGLVDVAFEREEDRAQVIAMLIERFEPKVTVAFTRDARIGEVLARFSREPQRLLLAIPAHDGDDLVGRVLGRDVGGLDELPFLSGDSETLRPEEHSARRKAAIIADLMEQLRIVLPRQRRNEEPPPALVR